MKRLMGLRSLLVAVAVSCAMAEPVLADTNVTSRLEALQVTVDAAGKEAFAVAGEVKPGDLIEYRLVYENAGKDPVSQLTVNGPVPKGTAYVVGSAGTQVKHELKFSYDGGQSWVAAPPLRAVRTADGKTSEKPAAPEEITNVEWLAREALKPGGGQAYRYRVKVLAAQ